MRIVGFSVFILVLVTGRGLAQKTEVSYDDSADFSQYKTYDWVPYEKIPIVLPGDAKQGDPKILDAQIRAAVEKWLQKRRYRKDTAKPDLLVAYLGVGRLKTEITQFDSGPSVPNLPYGHWEPSVTHPMNDIHVRREGTLTLDLVDAETNKLVWRSWATETFDKPLRKPKDARKKIEKVVKKMLKKFPPK